MLFRSASFIAEYVGTLSALALVRKREGKPLIEVGKFAEKRFQSIVIEIDGFENRRVGVESNRGARFLRFAHDLQLGFGNTAVVNLAENMPVLTDFGSERIRKRVNAGNADAVQAGRYFVSARLFTAAELSARVEVGKRELDPAYALFLVDARGYAPSVILYGTRADRKSVV